MFRIYPYKLASMSARRLKEVLGGGRPLLKPDGSYVYQDGDVIINWGNSEVPTWDNDNVRWLNRPQRVGVASHKLRTLEALREANVPTLEFTTDRRVAQGWMGDVYVRHRLQGHSGDGIEIVDQDTDLPQAPLYTKKIENNGEYRVHVVDGRVIDYRKKSRRVEDEPTEDQKAIRTLENGWIYRQGDLRRLERIEELAISAINALGLDFGAVDIIQDTDRNEYVLEVNTAVGLADNTLASYLEAFQQQYGRG